MDGTDGRAQFSGDLAPVHSGEETIAEKSPGGGGRLVRPGRIRTESYDLAGMSILHAVRTWNVGRCSVPVTIDGKLDDWAATVHFGR